MAHVVYNKTEGQKFTGESSFVIVECNYCGIPYGIPELLHRSMLRYHGDQPGGWKICCPMGHEWWYVGETREDRLQRLLNDERDETARVRSQRDQAQAHASAMKGVATRRKNQLQRVRAGVCPCCNRTFQNLARHMAGQHPDYDPGSRDR
jgi:hypothetical protein